ncbi:MAG: hypothetical protein Q9187_007653, partial [Circinaria calcarea]
MLDSRTYTVRPFSKPARSDQRDAFRVYLSPATLLLHKLRSGDACHLVDADGKPVPAIAWAAPEKIQDNIVQTSKALQSLHCLKLGDKVSLHREDTSVEDAQTVVLSELLQTQQDGAKDPLMTLDVVEQGHWKWLCKFALGKAEMLCPGLVFEIDVKEATGQKRSFRIEQINSSRTSDALYRFVPSCTVRLQDIQSPNGVSLDELGHSILVTRDGIGGLTQQLARLNKLLTEYSEGLRRCILPPFCKSRRGGILLHGPSGTGKTLILQKVAEAKWRKVLHLNMESIRRHGSNADSAVRTIFQDALRHQPSVIIIDPLDSVAGKLTPNENITSFGLTSSIREGFENLADARVLVIAATRKLSDIDESLRRPSSFRYPIEIPVPDLKTRVEILNVLTHLPRDAVAKDLEALGDRTHGFVGADLDEVIQFSCFEAEDRVLTSLSKNGDAHQGINGTDISGESIAKEHEPKDIKVEITEDDINNALLKVRPTAMQEVFLETPKVHWSDIGGQHEIKESLKQAVEWPFKYPTDMSRLNLSPKKGLLLYGPPGCSKTLTAKAIATESHLNFLAVKGAELLSMYVGESERAVRDVFRKARAASPSILFFDEIDAIGAAREGGPGGGGSGVNVLTTLLNELDGIEDLKGVFVLAATNQPQVLDPALMRPGRLDTILYVGPPNLDARREILEIQLRQTDTADDVDA